MLKKFSDASITERSRDPPTMYTILTYNSNSYRIKVEEYQFCHSILLFLSVFCIFLSLVALGTIIEDLFPQHGIIACSFAIGGAIELNIFTIYKREILGLFPIFSSVNFTLLLISWLVLLVLEIQFLIIPTSIILLIQIIASFFYLHKKGYLMVQCLLLGQFMLFALKMDGIMNSDWIASLFILVMITLSALLGLFFLILFYVTSFFIISLFSQDKKCGLIFIGSICLCIGINSGLPFLNFVFGLQFWIAGIIALVVNIFMVFCVYKFQQGIKVFFCKAQVLKNFNLNIYLKQIGQQHIKKYCFQKLSQNWYQKVRKTKRKKIKTQKQEKKDDCLICFENPYQVVWTPCGHLAICLECCQKMFQKKNACCVLCKALPSELYVVKSHQNQQGKKDQSKSEIQSVSELNEKKSEKTEKGRSGGIEDYEIEQGYTLQIC